MILATAIWRLFASVSSSIAVRLSELKELSNNARNRFKSYSRVDGGGGRGTWEIQKSTLFRNIGHNTNPQWQKSEAPIIAFVRTLSAYRHGGLGNTGSQYSCWIVTRADNHPPSWSSCHLSICFCSAMWASQIPLMDSERSFNSPLIATYSHGKQSVQEN